MKIYSSVDEFDEYDPYHGSKYRIDCGDYKTKYTDNPRTAISYWFQSEAKHPYDCAIMARNKKDALNLLKQATPELIDMMYEKYGCPYKIEFMNDIIERGIANNCKYFLGDGEYGDQVSPFSYA